MSLDSALQAASRKYRRVWVVLSLSIILIVVMSAFLSRSLETLNDGAAWVAHTERVQFELARTQQAMSDMGAGVTGYELLHDGSLFEPARRASTAIIGDLTALRSLLASEPPQGRLLIQLEDLIRQRQQSTEAQRERALNGDVNGVQADIAGGESRRIMSAAREVIGLMQAEEKRQFDRHSEATSSAYRALLFAIWAAAGVAILLLLALTLVTLRDAERLRRVQEELAIILRSVGDAVIATDAASSVRFMNAAAEQLTGWTNRAARGRSLTEVFRMLDEQTHEPAESPVTRVLQEKKGGLAHHAVLRSRDGQERPIVASGAPIRGGDCAVTGVVLVFRDATAEREARRVLLESSAALREADRRKDVFLATLSHELRNPLAPIRTATRVLEKPELTSLELERSRAIISRQVRHMAALLDDLMDISRITRGVLTLKTERVALRGLIETAIETAQPALSAKRHELTIEWPAEPVTLNADPVRMSQVIANLLGNAAKYTRADGHIVLGMRREAGKSGERAIISVRDNGIGIAPDMLARVFDMFSQIDAGQEHADGGVGIGLALVKGFVELHGGTVEARSAGRDRGSEFIVSLPIDAAPAVAAGAAAPTLTGAARPLSVLVADDNHDGAEILGMLLSTSGHQVQVAHTGDAALASAAEQHPDVAILDIGMPNLSGYEVAQRIRREPWGSRMCLIALTGWGQDEDKRKAMAAGFDHHLTKPIDPGQLERLLATADVTQDRPPAMSEPA